jgi:hypothetical protein
LECDAVGGETEAFEEDEGGGEGGVSAEIDFDGGGEPAETVAFRFLDEEGGFGEVVFGGDVLENGIGQPAFEGADGGGVAAEEFGGERVDLVKG